jgi:hypothetical protein
LPDPTLHLVQDTTQHHISLWTTFSDNSLDSFYQHFYPVHSFIPPKPWLLYCANYEDLTPLLGAVRWLGSLHMPPGPVSGDIFFQEAYALAYDGTRAQDGWLVQALLLLALGLELMCRKETARAALAYAEALMAQMEHQPRPLPVRDGRDDTHAALGASWKRTRAAVSTVQNVLRVPREEVVYDWSLLGMDADQITDEAAYIWV